VVIVGEDTGRGAVTVVVEARLIVVVVPYESDETRWCVAAVDVTIRGAS
jgi:hypothetical protein